jgi:hypothetical protein
MYPDEFYMSIFFNYIVTFAFRVSIRNSTLHVPACSLVPGVKPQGLEHKEVCSYRTESTRYIYNSECMAL